MSVFINLPVKDLEASKKFFVHLGFSINPQFTDDKAVSVVISDTIYAMLLLHPFFKTFTTREIVDTSKSIEVLNALSFDSREAVDSIMNKAIEAGGVESRDAQDLGFMYSRAFHDLDGHTWEVLWMNPEFVQK